MKIDEYDIIMTKMYADPDHKYSRLVTYVIQDLGYSVRQDFMSTKCSTIWLDIKGPKGKIMICGQIYCIAFYTKQSKQQILTRNS